MTGEKRSFFIRGMTAVSPSRATPSTSVYGFISKEVNHWMEARFPSHFRCFRGLVPR